MIADLAAALECQVTDLTGRPRVPADRQLELAHSRVDRVWQTLVEIAPDEPPDRPPPSIDALTERARLVTDLRVSCDYAGAGQLLPDLLHDLHAASSGPDSRDALEMLTMASCDALVTLKNLGYLAEATLAAERCRQAAERLEAPVPLAFAEWMRGLVAASAGSYKRCRTLTGRAADDLSHHLDADQALEILGVLHLGMAMSALGEHRSADALDGVDEAQRIAERTGETQSWSLFFGPTNVAVWRIGLEVDAGEAGRAVETAASVNPSLLESTERQAIFELEFARALADVQRDRDAVRKLLIAERLAPQRIRSHTGAQETARFLLDRVRRNAGESALRGLCERLGVTA